MPNFTAILCSIKPGTATTICSVFLAYLFEKGMSAEFNVTRNSARSFGVLNLYFLMTRPRLVNAAMRVLVPPMSMIKYIFSL